MAVLNRELGSYDCRGVVRFYGMFRADGTSDPDATRDGKTNQYDVVYTSQGLFTVTIADGFPIPQKLIFAAAHLHPAATVAKAQLAQVVRDSWDASARTFQIVVVTVGDVAGSAYADPVLSPPNDNDWISFELLGSISTAGTDLV